MNKYMKRYTILLVILMIVALVLRCFTEIKRREREEERQVSIEANNKSLYPKTNGLSLNKQLSNYEGIKVRGAEVRALFSIVETLNKQQVLPINIRYGDVLTDSYEWHAQGKEIFDSGDTIRDSAWYEVTIQNQLGNDGHLDTIAIRQY